jgi:predicted branched-subunit amino acid permease
MPDARTELRRSVIDALPYSLSVIPFGLVVGAVAVDTGLSLQAALLQSLLFFAGASQVVSLGLYGEGQPVWVVALAVFAVNFRMVLYSAAIGRKLEPIEKPKMGAILYLLQDISFALGMKRAEQVKLTFAYMMGHSLVFWALWVSATGVGVIFGNLISNPRAIGLDMLVPIYFLLLMLGFRSKPNSLWVFGVSAFAATTGYLTLGSPYHIAFGGLAGMLAAALLCKPVPPHEAEQAQSGV